MWKNTSGYDWYRWLKIASAIVVGLILLAVLLLTLTACNGKPPVVILITPTPVVTVTPVPAVTLTPTPPPEGYPRVVRSTANEQYNDNGTAVASVGLTICQQLHDVYLETAPNERFAVEGAETILAMCVQEMAVQPL